MMRAYLFCYAIPNIFQQADRFFRGASGYEIAMLKYSPAITAKDQY